MLLFKRNRGVDGERTVYKSSIEALKQILWSEKKTRIVNLTPKGSKLYNGIEYCLVEIKDSEERIYSVIAYGKEAQELHEEASLMVETPVLIVS